MVVPSSYEGYGIVYREGMAFGLPAIGTTSGGASEIITDGENGYLSRQMMQGYWLNDYPRLQVTAICWRACRSMRWSVIASSRPGRKRQGRFGFFISMIKNNLLPERSDQRAKSKGLFRDCDCADRPSLDVEWAIYGLLFSPLPALQTKRGRPRAQQGCAGCVESQFT